MLLLDRRAGEISAVDVEDLEGSMLLIGSEQSRRRLVLRDVVRLDCRPEDQSIGDRDVPLVPVESLRLALATVAHLDIADRDDAIRRDALLDFRSAIGRIWFGILLDHPPPERQVILQR